MPKIVSSDDKLKVRIRSSERERERRGAERREEEGRGGERRVEEGTVLENLRMRLGIILMSRCSVGTKCLQSCSPSPSGQFGQSPPPLRMHRWYSHATPSSIKYVHSSFFSAGEVRVVSLFLDDWGIDPDLRNGEMQTPLFIAVLNKNVPLTAYLVKVKNASRLIMSVDGRLPIDVANEYGMDELIKHVAIRMLPTHLGRGRKREGGRERREREKEEERKRKREREREKSIF
jgi:hypothetical protein